MTSTYGKKPVRPASAVAGLLLCALVLLCLAPSDGWAEARTALVIGNATYRQLLARFVLARLPHV